MHARQDLDQGRLARAVVADQGHHFAGMHVEVDIGQRRNSAEILADAAQAEQQLAGRGGVARDCPSLGEPFA